MGIFFHIFRNFTAYIKSEMNYTNHNRKKMMPYVPGETRKVNQTRVQEETLLVCLLAKVIQGDLSTDLVSFFQ